MGARLTPAICIIFVARSFRLILWPQAMLKTPSASLSMARMFALTTSFTKVKSRVCPPSPKIMGGSFARILVTNLGMTAAYSDAGSCLGP